MRNCLLRRAGRIPALLLLLFSALASAHAYADQGGDAGSPQPDGLLLEVKTEKTRVYVREPVSLTVTLLTGPVTVRNIEYPRLNSSAFTLGEFGPPRQRNVVRDGRDFIAYEFTTILTPKRSGALLLGPAELRCELLGPAAGPAVFFGGTEARRVTIRSAAVPVTALPLPDEGQPAGFNGAVGRFTVTMTARPTTVQAGDPVTVRTLIRGTGNIDAFSCNFITGPGLRSYQPHTEFSGSTLACEQVVIPESPAVREIPAARVQFFDPETKQYRTAMSGPVSLRVRATPAPSPSMPHRSTAQAQPPTPSPSSVTVFPVGVAAVLLLAAGIGGTFLVRRRRAPLPVSTETDPAAVIRNWFEAAETALDAGDVDDFYTAVFRALQSAVGNRLNLPPAGITGPLRQDGLPAAVFQSARSLISQCDKVRYGKQKPGSAEMSADLQMLRELVNNSCH